MEFKEIGLEKSSSLKNKRLMGFLHNLAEYLPHEGFTLQEIYEELNEVMRHEAISTGEGNPSVRVNYSEKDLYGLIRCGLVETISSGKYQITPEGYRLLESV